MKPLQLARLLGLMERSSGSPDVTIGLIDGPVATTHPDLASDHFREIPGRCVAWCTETDSAACQHGTFVAGILSAKRTAPAPAISPDCTLIIRPVFAETAGTDRMPSATPRDVAAAIVECINAGARVINLSLALAHPSARGDRYLQEALDEAIRRNVIVVAAAGNQGALGSSAITRHPAVIPVVACDVRGRPLDQSNLSGSIGRRGLTAPGDAVTSLSAEGPPVTLAGTSVAAPFVTGTIALLWSVFPAATVAQITVAVTQVSARRRASIVPPLLDAAAAYQSLLITNREREPS